MPRLRYHILLLLLMAATSCLNQVKAQAPVIQWQRSIGGIHTDIANTMVSTIDGGCIIAGSSDSNDGDITGNHGSEDYVVVKMDSLGNMEWQKSYGGSRSDIATCIQAVSSGGYIVAGYSASNDGDVTGKHGADITSDYWIVKLDDKGSIEWQQCLGGSDYDYAFGIAAAEDDGYIVVGMSSSNNGDVTGDHGNGDCWVVKLDQQGKIEWQKSLGGYNPETGYAVKTVPGSGYVVVGFAFSRDGDVANDSRSGQVWVLKLSKDGNLQWQQSIGGTAPYYGTDIALTRDGGYIITGRTNSDNAFNPDYLVAKLNSAGNKEWTKHFGGSAIDYGQSIRETPDGGYIVAGFSTSIDSNIANHGGADAWLLKLNANGDTQWQQCYGGSSDDQAFAITCTTDGGYIFAGASASGDGDVNGNHGSSDCWVVKLGCKPVMPSIHIIPPGIICDGYHATIISTVTNGGATPAYQWIKNNQPVGNNATYTSASKAENNDSIFCLLTSNDPCAVVKTVSSDTIVLKISQQLPGVLPSVVITSPGTNFCSGANVLFNAVIKNNGDSIANDTVTYRWFINDVEVGTDANTFSTTQLKNNDTVSCVVTFANSCQAEIVSNKLRMVVQTPLQVVCMPDTTISAGNSVVLRATVYGNVDHYEWSPVATLSDAFIASPLATPFVTTTYHLQVSAAIGCIATGDITVTVKSTLHIPNAFSPNNDGINDTWQVYGLNDDVVVSVFDRYGNTVFTSKGYTTPWDGMRNGKPLLAGTYYYMISMEKNKKQMNGSLTIIR